MHVLGIGVDLVHVPRIVAILNRRGPRRLASRILSPDEFVDWKSLSSSESVRFLSVRWAMKEAAYKALYPTVTARWKELTYQGLAEGRKPTLYYHPFTPVNSEKVGRLHASVSHDGDYVFTSVLVECPPIPIPTVA